jgi:ribosomal protein L7/L12
MKSMNSNTSLVRRVGLMALAISLSWFSSPAFGQTLTGDVLTALSTLNASLTAAHKPTVSLTTSSVTITATEVGTLVYNLANSSVTRGNIANDISTILQVINAAAGVSGITTGDATVASAAPDCLSSVNTAFSNLSGAAKTTAYTTLFPSAVQALAATANYSNSGLAESGATSVDTDVTTNVTKAVGEYGAVGLPSGDVISAVINNSYEPQSYVFQGTLVGAELTGSSQSVVASVATELAINNGSTLTSSGTATGAFLASFLTKATTAGVQEGFLQGYTAVTATNGASSVLVTTASNILAQTVSTFPLASRENVFIGLTTSGTLNGIVLVSDTATQASVVQGVAAGVLSGYTYGASASANDALKETLANDLLTSAYASYANSIAIAGIGSLTGGSADIGALSKTLVANTQIGSTGAASMVQAVATADFPVAAGNTAAGGPAGNLANLVALAQGAIASKPTLASQITTAAVQQVIHDLGTTTDEATFAESFATSICTSGNGLTVSDAYRASMGTALAEAYDYIAGAPETIVTNVAATDATSKQTFNAVTGPILVNFMAISSTETGAIAASLSKLAATFSNNIEDSGFVGGQLMLTAGTNAALLKAIALGLATDSTVTSSGGLYGTQDAWLTSLSSWIKGTNADVWNAATVLATAPGWTAPEVAGALASGTGMSASLAASLSGTIAKTISNGGQLGESSTLAAIAYAAANVTGGTTVDTNRQAIAKAVLTALSNSDTYIPADAVQVSGSVATIISESASNNDKGTFAKTIASLATSGTGNVSAIALAVAQTVPTGDAARDAEIAAITNSAVGAFASTALADPNANTDIGTVANNVITNYSGTPLATSGGNLVYGDEATITAAVLKGNTAAGTSILTDVLNTIVVSNSNTIPALAAAFAGDVYPVASTSGGADVALIARLSASLDVHISTNGDAGTMTTDILNSLAAIPTTGVATAKAQAPNVAQAIATGIGSTNLTVTEAEAIAENAAGYAGVTVANQGLAATNVITVLSSGLKQTALDSIAQYISNNIATVTDLGKTTITADQQTFANALASTYPTLSATNIAYDVATAAVSGTAIGDIAETVLKAPGGTLSGGTTTGAIDTFTGNLVTLLQANNSLAFNYAGAAIVAKTLIAGFSTVTGLGNALTGSLIQEELGDYSGAAATIAQDFTAAVPASYVAISSTTAAYDTTISTDAGPITAGVLKGLGSTSGAADAPAVAQAVASGIGTLHLTAPEAEAIADYAVETTGITVTAANQNLVASNVIALVSSGLQQNALNLIATDISTNMGTEFPSAALTDQEGLAKALALAFPTSDQIALIADVANPILTSTASVAQIQESVMKAPGTTLTTGTVTYFTDAVVAKLGYTYAQAPTYAADVIGDNTAVTGLATPLLTAMVEQYVGSTGSNYATSMSIASDFATTIPTSAIAITNGATQSSLYLSLTPLQSGSIAAAVASVNNAAITPGVTGTIAVIAAVNSTSQSNLQVFDGALIKVANVFANYPTVPVATGSNVAVALTGTAGTNAQNIHDTAGPVIAAQFFLGSVGTAGGAVATNFLNAMAKYDAVNAADVLGAYIDLYDPSAESGGSISVVTSAETTLINQVIAAMASLTTPATNMSILTGLSTPGNALFGLSATSHPTYTSELTTILDQAAEKANVGAYNGFGSLTGAETPTVEM